MQSKGASTNSQEHGVQGAPVLANTSMYQEGDAAHLHRNRDSCSRDGRRPLPCVCLPQTLLCAAATAESLRSCLTLCDPIDSSPPGSPSPGILQARTLEWVAISFSNAWKWKGKVKSLSCVRLLAAPWTAAYQAPPSMGFYRQEYWSGVTLPSLLFLCILHHIL